MKDTISLSSRNIWILVVLKVGVVLTSTTPTTLPPTSPQQMTTVTTTPLLTTPPGSCEYDGRTYTDGEVVEEDEYNCFGAICQYGAVTFWDDICFLYTPPPCGGVEERVVGKCCPVCHNDTTTPPTTTPVSTTPPGGCLFNGIRYKEGEEFDTSPCGGYRCLDGQIIAWDHECAFMTPSCNGWQEYVTDQCCPICHNTTTTSTTTTTAAPPDGCIHNGTVYRNYDVFSLSEDGCTGLECHYGMVRPWRERCQPETAPCTNGKILVQIPGDCCPKCAVTTTPIPPTCDMNGKKYKIGERTNNDVCNVCTCTRFGEKCLETKCPTTDCKTSYRPTGTCCFICAGSTSVRGSWLFSLCLLLLHQLS